jgi:FixJ family two-component response regulator
MIRSTIAIIDDDASIRASTSSLVRSHGYTAFTFASAEAFLQSDQLRETSCIISDVRMPAMSGIDLQAHLLAQGHRVPFIFVTAFPEEGTFTRVMKAGATCFLTKPFDGPSLIACLDRALGRTAEPGIVEPGSEAPQPGSPIATPERDA